MKAHATLDRLRDTGIQTLGKFRGFRSNMVEKPLELVTLEPSNLFNMPWISCIPAGKYTVVKHVSPRFGKCFLVKDVEGRTDILFHSLNFYQDTQGCIGVGMRFGHLNRDGIIDVSDSSTAMSRMLEYMPNEFELEIREIEGFQKAYTTA